MNLCYSPTPHADVHIGHAWIAWLNWREAQLTGGEFVVMWDDVTYNNGACESTGFAFECGVTRTREQLKWLGMEPDRECYWSEFMEAGKAACERLGYKLPRRVGLEPVHHNVVLHPQEPVYAAIYEPGLTVCWVVGDFLAGIDGYYTGRAFESTCCLYEDICRRLGYRSVRRQYVPEVRRETLTAKESQSKGAVSILDLRLAGYEPWQIISTLRECDWVSRLKGLADTVIPAGLLEPGELKWLLYQGDVINAKATLGSYGRHAGGADVRAYVARVKRDNEAIQRAVTAR